MQWKAIEKDLQPIQGAAWYVTDGESDLHCGQGPKGKERAESTAKLLTAGSATLAMRDQKTQVELMKHLNSLFEAAQRIDPDIQPNIREGHQLYPILLAARTMMQEVSAIHSLLVNGA